MACSLKHIYIAYRITKTNNFLAIFFFEHISDQKFQCESRGSLDGVNINISIFSISIIFVISSSWGNKISKFHILLNQVFRNLFKLNLGIIYVLGFHHKSDTEFFAYIRITEFE